MSPRPRISAFEFVLILIVVAMIAFAAWRTGPGAVTSASMLGACEMPGDGRPLIVLVSERAGRLVAECIRIKPAEEKTPRQRPA